MAILPTMDARTRAGYAFMSAEVLFGATMPIVIKLSYASLQPVFAAAIAMFMASVFFAAVVTLRGRWSDLLVRKAWYDVLRMTLLIVVGFYALYYWGLQRTSAANAAIISRFEIVTSIVVLGLLSRHERVTRAQVIGGGCMMAGIVLALFAGTTKPGIGDMAIVFGTFLTPLGNVSQQRARAMISGEAVFLLRSLIGGSLLLCIAFLIETPPTAAQLRSSLPLMLFAGIAYFGFGKLLWVEALHRLPITTAIPLASVGAVLTIFLAAPVLDEPVRGLQLLALIPVFIGIRMLTRTPPKYLPEEVD